MIRKLDNKIIPVLATLCLAGALTMSVGCADDDDDDCVGAGCLSPASDVDAGGELQDIPCAKMCSYVFTCEDTPKVGVDNNNLGSEGECMLKCESGLFTDEEMSCLSTTTCGGIPACLDDLP